MTGPSAEEAYLLELLNEARLDPLASANRFITSYIPLTSPDAQITGAMEYFGVDGSALLEAFSSLSAAGPLAWNDKLASAARLHNGALIEADEQSHQVDGEPPLGLRLTNAGYEWSIAGENVYAFALNLLYTHAGFMVDWGYDQEDYDGQHIRSEFATIGDGMQDEAGHRYTIMNPNFLEVGIAVTYENLSSTEVGPMVATQNFAAPAATASYYYVTGVAYNDTNNNRFFDPNEGIAGLQVNVRLGGVKSNEAGSYNLAVFPGPTTITLAQAGLDGPVTVTANIVSENLKLDVVNGDTLVTSGSVTVSGPVYNIRGVGQSNLSITGDFRSQAIEGSSGNDTLNGQGGADVLFGAGGNDSLIGGNGIDIARYTGNKSQYSVVNNNGIVTISGNGEGTDTARGVEVFRFADGDYAFNAATGKLVSFGDNGSAAGPRALLPQPAYNAKDVVSIKGYAYTDKNGNGGFNQGEGRDDFDLAVRLGGKGSDATGAYTLAAFAGPITATLTGGGIDGEVKIDTTLATKDLLLDIVNGNTLVTSGSMSVSGEISTIRGVGSDDLTLIGDFRDQTIIGSSGHDSLFAGSGSDVLAGGLGNDRLIGGSGIDTAVFTGKASAFTVTSSNGSVLVSGNGQGTDTLWGIEIYRFDDGEYIYDGTAKSLVPFGENAGPPLGAINNPPVIEPVRSVTTQAGKPLAIKIVGTDADGDVITYAPALNPQHGTLTGSGGNFTYTPNSGFSGTDTFTVTLNDGKGGTATHTVQVTVVDANLAPVVLPTQTVETETGKAVAILIQANDPDGDTLTYVASTPEHGTVVVKPGGVLTYKPEAGFTGTDEFTVTVSDGNGGTSKVDVSVEVLAEAAPIAANFTVTTTSGFAGTIGGVGNVFGTNGYQKITLADTGDKLIFDPSFNKGGDTVELPNAASSYIAFLDGSTVTIQDGDSQYYFPVGQNPISLLFADGARSLFVDTASNSVKIGNQTLSEDASLITAPPSGSAGASQLDPNAFANVTMIGASQVTVDGDYFIFGGAATQKIFYRGGDVDRDGSFNKGGDIIMLSQPISAYSAYLAGSSLVLVSSDGKLTIPMGTSGITLNFDGTERTALIDQGSMSVKVGDIEITSTNANNPDSLQGGISLDVGTPIRGVEIDLTDGVAYTLLEDLSKGSNVTINGFDEDDKISVTGGDLDDYFFTHNGDDLIVTRNDGVTFNSITIADVEADGLVYNAATAIQALGWDFITIA